MAARRVLVCAVAVLTGVASGGAVAAGPGITVTPPSAAPALRAPGHTRLSDSRPGGRTVDGTGSGAGALTPGVVRKVTVTGRGGIVATGAVVLNIQAVNPLTSGYLTAWPCDQPQPATSLLNVTAGGPSVANTTILALGTSKLCVRSTAVTDLVVDTEEQFVADNGFVAATGRVVDSRSGLGGVTRLVAGVAQPLPDLGAAVVNVTAVNPSGVGYLSIIPCDWHSRGPSTVNFAGSTTANMAMPLQQDLCATSSVDSDLVIDRVGNLPATTQGLAHGPLADRLLDTRNPPSSEPSAVTRLRAGVVHRVQLYGKYEAWPARSGAAALNLTTVRSSGTGTLQLFKCAGVARTTVAYPTTRAVSHLTFVDLSQDESFCVVSTVDTDLVVDGARWFTTPKRPLHVEANEACFLQMAPATITLDGPVGSTLQLDVSGGVAPYTFSFRGPAGWVLASVLPAFDSPQNPILQLDVQHPSTPLGITTFDVTVTDRAGATGTVTYQLVNDGHTSLPGTC